MSGSRTGIERRWSAATPSLARREGHAIVEAAAAPSALERWATLTCRLLAALAIAPVLGACSSDLSCSGPDVQTALRRALDDVYAESRTMARVDLTIKDIVSVSQSEQSASCKAMVHLEITYLGVAQAADPIIPYTAERTDNGQVLVTARPD